MDMPQNEATTLKDSWNNNLTVNTTGNDVHSCMLMTSLENNEDIVTPELTMLILKFKAAVLMPVIFMFGAPSNLLSIIVFFKQGLNDRVNLCLFSLSLVDFLSVSFYFFLYSEHMFMFNSQESYGPLFAFVFNNKITIFYSCPYAAMFLSAVISMERCVCVLFPLHTKTFLKTKYMAIIIGVGVPLITFLRLVVMAKYAVVCFFDQRTQQELLDLYITDFQLKNKEFLNFLDGIFYGFVIAVGCPFIVLAATVITSIKLWQTVSWRQEVFKANSRKEMAVTKMLIWLSLQFLVFCIPAVFTRIYPLHNPEFSSKGRNRLLFRILANVTEVSVHLSTTVSFIVYYFTSSRYRQIIHDLFTNMCILENRSGVR